MLALLMSACGFGFTPDIDPLVIEEIPDLPASSDLPHPEDGTLTELAYWEEQLGFGTDERPSLDQFFDPYHRSQPVTGDEGFGPTDELREAAERIYENEGDLDELVRDNLNNPINYWDEDPITVLEGEARLQMSFVMASTFTKPHIGRFLDIIGADPSLYWNYEPAWVAAQMRLHPHALLQANTLKILKIPLWQ